MDGAEGGTGAAPMPLIDDVGLPLRESLPLLIDELNEYGLRERVRVVASGKLITPTDVAWALCMGTDFVVAARGFMFSLGCIQGLQCNRNTCPTGITTHNKRLQKGLNQKLKSFGSPTTPSIWSTKSASLRIPAGSGNHASYAASMRA